MNKTNTTTMETFKIEPTDNGELIIECLNCDFWENAPEDIPRRKLNIVTNVSDDGRYTDCQCPECLHKWRLDWDEAL